MIVLTVVSESDICIPMFVKSSCLRVLVRLRKLLKENRASSTHYLAAILMDYDTVSWNYNDLPTNRVVVDFNECTVKWNMGKTTKTKTFRSFF